MDNIVLIGLTVEKVGHLEDKAFNVVVTNSSIRHNNARKGVMSATNLGADQINKPLKNENQLTRHIENLLSSLTPIRAHVLLNIFWS